MNTDENFLEEEPIELSSDGVETARRIAFLEESVHCRLLRVLVDMWAYAIHVKRAEEMLGTQIVPNMVNPHAPNVRPTEEAIYEMYKAFGWGEPFEEYQRQARIAAQKANDLHFSEQSKENDRTLRLLQAEQDRVRDMKKRLHDEFTMLDTLLLEITATEVTHAERRGQLALLREALRRAQNRIEFADTDIPF